MRTISMFLLLSASIMCHGQSTLIKKYDEADSLMQIKAYLPAFNILKEIEPLCDKTDTLYRYIVWDYTVAAAQLGRQEMAKENWEASLKYSLEALAQIEMGESLFDEKYGARRYWTYKNIIAAYFGLDQLENAKKYQLKLYKAYKDKKLPDGIDKYYNFEFFKWEGKNIWGYEYYPELGDPETEGSFSKIVYYIYSTNADGSDKDQLYRLHILKFHKLDESVKIDYILTKRVETATDEVDGTFFNYTYLKALDYKKIRADIRTVLKGNHEPNIETSVKKK